MHWPPNEDEWQYYVKGTGRLAVFAAGGHARTMDFHEGDVGYIERSMPHYIENLGDTDLVFEVFPSPKYQGISLAEWLAHTPSRLWTSISVLARTCRAKSPERKQLLRPNDRDRAQLELT